MSQTPTKGPWMVSHGEVPGLGMTLGVIQSSHPQGITRPAICVISDEARINDEDRANAALIAEAGTVYHETKQTPRQILESREALRAGAEELLASLDRAMMPHCGVARGSMLDMASQSLRSALALTLAKEGGQA